jgi:hypothetical protein
LQLRGDQDQMCRRAHRGADQGIFLINFARRFFPCCFVLSSFDGDLRAYSMHTYSLRAYCVHGLRLDRSMDRYIYKAKNGKLLVILTPSQKAKLIFEQYIQTLFSKDLF